MNWYVFTLSLVGLQLFCLAAGFVLAKGMKGNKDYFLAGRSVRFFPLMMTLVATQVGGGLVLGAAQEAYTYGWSVLLYPLGQSLGFVLLACGIGSRMAESGVSTVAELCERAFGSRKLRQAASILSMVSLFMVFVGQVIASKKFIISLGWEGNAAFMAFWTVVVIYTVSGGLKGVIAIDLIQAIFFILVFVAALFFADLPQEGLFGSYKESIFEADPTYKMWGWLLMPMLFMAIEQDMGQRCFAADNPRTVTRAAFASAIVTFSVATIPVLFGVAARVSDIDVSSEGSVFMTVIQELTNPTISALAAVAILAVLMSTVISLINAISSNLTQDFSWGNNRKGGSVLVAQVLTTTIAAFGLFFAQYFDSIVGILILSYDLSVSSLFIPVMVALFRKRGSLVAAWLSFIGGAIAFFGLRIIPYELPKEILSIAISALCYWVTATLEKKRRSIA